MTHKYRTIPQEIEAAHVKADNLQKIIDAVGGGEIIEVGGHPGIEFPFHILESGSPPCALVGDYIIISRDEDSVHDDVTLEVVDGTSFEKHHERID